MIGYFLVAFIIAMILTRLLSRYRGRFALLDTPNERSLHAAPTPRTGGVGIIIAVTTVWLLIDRAPGVTINWLMLAGVLPIIAISLIDDIRHVPAWLRLVFQFAAAVIVISFAFGLNRIMFAGYVIELGMIGGGIFSALFLVWMTNLYNFMDGMDGFAGGMAIFGFGCYAILGLLTNDPLLLVLAGTVSFATAGFLLFNFPPARIFLGDAGAGFLGFLAAVLGLYADRQQVLPLLGSILLFSPFIVDATVTLLRRLRAREAVWRAHRSHFYQRLVQTGWSHRRTVLWEYLLMLATAISAILLFYNNNPGFELGLFVFWVAVYGGLGAWVSRAKST